jgi:hypothetical protein
MGHSVTSLEQLLAELQLHQASWGFLQIILRQISK